MLIDTNVTAEQRVANLVQTLLILACVYAVGIVTNYVQARLMLKISQNTTEALRRDLFNSVQELPVRFFDGTPTGETMSRFTNDIDNIDFDRDIYLYSQTTKSLQGFQEIVRKIAARNADKHTFESYDTICRQVANRIDKIREFAAAHELIIFVSGKKSSNGKILFAECLDANPNSHLISSEDELCPEWLIGKQSIGICGATSTPMWLMNNVKTRIEQLGINQ